jgi:Family of unknown function (DUF6496)
MARHQSPAQKKTVERVMHEFKHGELKTAGGKRKVKNPKQAIAIALHEAGASKYENPKENARNLRRTKEKERRGETGQDAAEGKGRRKTSAARTSTRKSSSTKSSSTKRTRTAAARSSSPTRSASAKRTSSTTKRTSGAKRSSSTKRAASTARGSSTKRATSTARASSAKRSAATKRASSTGRKRSSEDGKTRAELYKEASRRNISGRSKMSKAQLERALSR